MKYYTAIYIFLGCIFLVACEHIEMFNGYKSTEYAVEQNIALTFSMEMTPIDDKKGTTVYGEPYKLMVFVPYLPDFKRVSLKNVSLVGVNKNQISLPMIYKDLSRINRSYKGSVILEYDIDQLEYQNYILSGQLVISRKSEQRTYPFEVTLKTDYREEKINKFWENLMGI